MFDQQIERRHGGLKMKKLMMTTGMMLLIFTFAAQVNAVPDLGVATDTAYIGSTGQTVLEAYQDYFVDTFIPGSNATHGFAIGPSPTNLFLFTNITNANIWILTTADVLSANSPAINSTSLSPITFTSGDHFEGFSPTPYYGLNLGQVDSSWATLPDPPFNPGTFYSLSVDLTYSGTIQPGQYFFAVADDNGTSGFQGAGGAGKKDNASPATTSAVGYKVPEPSTFSMSVIGLFLCVLAVAFTRKRSSLSNE
jgi:hypothetical protein